MQNQSTVDSILEKVNISQRIKDAFVNFISLADKLYRLLNQEEDITKKYKNVFFCRKVIEYNQENIHNLLNL